MPTGARTRNTADVRRRPVVAGVAGGVATSTVAVALGATDAGVFTGRPVDVITCRATGDSLIRAATAAQLIIGDGRRPPVVAVTAANSSGPSRPVSARLRLLEPHTSGVIVLPYVRRWASVAAPLNEVAALASRPQEVSRQLRGYAATLCSLQNAVRQLVGPPASAQPRSTAAPMHRPSSRAAGKAALR